MRSKRSDRAPRVDVFEVCVGDGEPLVVLSLPVGDEILAGLTEAERAVARDAISGLSNAAIARRRGSSPRTVANQLAAIYRKLGVTSRAELVVTLTGHATP